MGLMFLDMCDNFDCGLKKLKANAAPENPNVVNRTFSVCVTDQPGNAENSFSFVI